MRAARTIHQRRYLIVVLQVTCSWRAEINKGFNRSKRSKQRPRPEAKNKYQLTTASLFPLLSPVQLRWLRPKAALGVSWIPSVVSIREKPRKARKMRKQISTDRSDVWNWQFSNFPSMPRFTCRSTGLPKGSSPGQSTVGLVKTRPTLLETLRSAVVQATSTAGVSAPKRARHTLRNFRRRDFWRNQKKSWRAR